MGSENNSDERPIVECNHTAHCKLCQETFTGYGSTEKEAEAAAQQQLDGHVTSYHGHGTQYK